MVHPNESVFIINHPKQHYIYLLLLVEKIEQSQCIFLSQYTPNHVVVVVAFPIFWGSV